MRDRTTVTVPRDLLERLKKLRIHERQPIYEVIELLLEIYEKYKEGIKNDGR